MRVPTPTQTRTPKIGSRPQNQQPHINLDQIGKQVFNQSLAKQNLQVSKFNTKQKGSNVDFLTSPQLHPQQSSNSPTTSKRHNSTEKIGKNGTFKEDQPEIFFDPFIPAQFNKLALQPLWPMAELTPSSSESDFQPKKPLFGIPKSQDQPKFQDQPLQQRMKDRDTRRQNTTFDTIRSSDVPLCIKAALLKRVSNQMKSKSPETNKGAHLYSEQQVVGRLFGRQKKPEEKTKTNQSQVGGSNMITQKSEQDLIASSEGENAKSECKSKANEIVFTEESEVDQDDKNNQLHNLAKVIQNYYKQSTLSPTEEKISKNFGQWKHQDMRLNTWKKSILPQVNPKTPGQNQHQKVIPFYQKISQNKTHFYSQEKKAKYLYNQTTLANKSLQQNSLSKPRDALNDSSTKNSGLKLKMGDSLFSEPSRKIFGKTTIGFGNKKINLNSEENSPRTSLIFKKYQPTPQPLLQAVKAANGAVISDKIVVTPCRQERQRQNYSNNKSFHQTVDAYSTFQNLPPMILSPRAQILKPRKANLNPEQDFNSFDELSPQQASKRMSDHSSRNDNFLDRKTHSDRFQPLLRQK